MRRFLDVLLQHLRWSVLALLGVPLLVAGAFWFGDSHEVGIAIRVDPADFVGDALSDLIPPSNSAPAYCATLIRQLLETDWFSDRLGRNYVTTAVGRRSQSGERNAELATLRSRLAIDEGSSLLILTYPTRNPDRGVALLGALARTVGDTVRTVESQRAGADLQAATTQLQRARDEMQRSMDDVSRYASLSDLSGDSLAQDPSYLKLVVVAQAATRHLEDVDALSQQARARIAELPHVSSSTGVVVDAPRALPRARMAAARRYWLVGLVGTSATAALVVYLIALLDPRLRSLDDLRGRIVTPRLFTVPPTARSGPPR